MENKLLIRAHQQGGIMSEPKSKVDKEAGKLGETAKGIVEKIWLADNFDYRENVTTDEMKKGLLCEQDSMQLVQDVLGGEFRTKNTVTFKNDYCVGTPDIVLKNEDFDEDIKTSYNLRTFFEAEFKKGNNYWWQGQDYMWLTGKKNYRLIYCLVPTPDSIILEEKKRVWFKFDCDETNPDYIEISMQIDHNNNIINSLPKEKRIKVFEFGIDLDAIEQIKIQHAKAQIYYNSLELKSYVKPC